MYQYECIFTMQLLGAHMKKRNLHLLIITILLSILMLTGCNSSTKSELQEEQAAFDLYLDELFREIASSDTLTLNYTILNPSTYQIEKPTPTLGEFTIESMQQTSKHEYEQLQELLTFKYEHLTKNQQLCYDMIKDTFSLDCKYEDYILYHEVLGPTTGLQAQLPILLAEYNFNSTEDINEYLDLLKDIPRYFEQICSFEIVKSNAGLFMSDDVANEIINQCSSFIHNPESNYLIDCFNDKIDSYPNLSDTLKAQYKEKNLDYVLNSVIPAYDNLIKTLNELLGTGKNNQGLYYYKYGKSYYEYYVHSRTGSSRSLDELALMLDDTISSSLSNMSQIIHSDSDISNKLETYEYKLTEPQEILTYLQRKISTDFPSLPSVQCDIKYVHKSLQDYVSPAMYLIPQLDNYMKNSIYINTNPNYDMSKIFTTIAHEGYPGHLYQCVYFRSQDIHPIRNVVTNLGYEEGWATYAEMYSYSISGLDSSVADILKYNMIATHCLYSRADIGIHYEGWTYEQVESYLSKYLSPDACQIIYKVLLEEPGLYLPYSIGYLEIMQLRNTAEKELGSKFNLKDFHTFLLNLGPVNFDIIQNRMNDWLKEYK